MVRHLSMTALIVASIYVGLIWLIGHDFARANSSPEQAELTQINVTSNEDVRPVAASPVITLFAGQPKEMVGVSADIDLTSAEAEIKNVWHRLMNDQTLISLVDWQKGDIKAYAYYSGFNEAMTQAHLSIGFDINDLLLQSDRALIYLPQGKAAVFALDKQTGIASQEAWAKAYLHKNLIERHTLNQQGSVIQADAIVVMK